MHNDKNTLRLALLVAGALALSTAVPAAAPGSAAPAGARADRALALARELIALPSVRGEGNRTPEVAATVVRDLRAAGWQDKDLEILPLEDTAYLIATWPGTDAGLKPLVISGHMDVVAARSADWQRDPFTPVVENGYLYGRGASDMKFDMALAITVLADLRRAGHRPRRSIVVAFSGDEETSMRSSQLIAQRLRGAEMVLNLDGGGGTLGEADGKPLYWTWQGAEKTYADFRLEVTNPGGHSSMPRPENAIVQLAGALARIGAHHFKPELSELTREAFIQSARFHDDPKVADAMRRFAADPTDAGAIAVLRNDPGQVGKIATTCVPTLLAGGHAENALPQRATANINCRIFPGHPPAEVMAELQRVAAEPALRISDVTEGSVASPASPLRADFARAIERALAASHPGVPYYPVQGSGASDSMWYRALGIPSYGISAQFIKDSDDYAHGLDERVPLSNLQPALAFYTTLFQELSR